MKASPPIGKPWRHWQPTAARVVALASLVLILILSWVPGEDRPHTGVSNLLEHFSAYLLSTGANLVAFVPPRRVWMVVLWMAVLAGVAEIGQNFVPGRDSRVIDFLVSALGAVIAAIVFAAVRRR